MPQLPPHRDREQKRTTGLGTTISVGAAYTAPVWKGLVGGLLLTQRIDGMYSWTEGPHFRQHHSLRMV